MSYINVLMLGDIVGKPGRKALMAKLPKMKKELKADLVIANVENLSHGFGVSEKTLIEMQNCGVDFFTSGNHVFEKKTDLSKLFSKFPLIRPANIKEKVEGEGYKMIEVGTYKVLIINLIGQFYFEEKYANPFLTLDEILLKNQYKKPNIIIVDFHAEATSEKKSLGWYADGRVSLLVGTHTHVPTADAMILPKGTGYITDLGMVGIKHSSLGVDFENVLKNFLTEEHFPKIIKETGLCTINGIIAKIDIESGKTTKIKTVLDEVKV